MPKRLGINKLTAIDRKLSNEYTYFRTEALKLLKEVYVIVFLVQIGV
jgi:hypothetical protein